ncbi:hypothetical protein ACFXA8_03525, partial [Streptomyces sp. NPDC059409]
GRRSRRGPGGAPPAPRAGVDTDASPGESTPDTPHTEPAPDAQNREPADSATSSRQTPSQASPGPESEHEETTSREATGPDTASRETAGSGTEGQPTAGPDTESRETAGSGTASQPTAGPGTESREHDGREASAAGPVDGSAPEQPGQEAALPAKGAAPGSDLPDDATMALFLPALTDPETRPEPASDPYAIGPDAHDRTPDEGAARTPATPVVPDPEPTRVDDPAPDRADGPAPDRTEASDPVTDKGLPKRTPKLTAPAAVPRPRTSGSVDADALRRRLGGFRRGAEAGRRDVEAEIADRTGQNPAPDAAADTTEEATGGTVEEASS